MDHDVIVVGTGYGGAAAAAVLARAGLRVGILERGTWWGAFGGHRPLPETLPQLLGATEGLNLSAFGRSVRIPLSRRGLLEVHLHGSTILMNALAVGGTSRPECILCNRCMMGCNVGAKQSVDMTILPRALEAGAVLRDRCAVQNVEPIEGGYAVRFHDLRSGSTATWKAPRVVLAAGTLNTLRILFRSKGAGGLTNIRGLGEQVSLGADSVEFYRMPRDLPVDANGGHGTDWVMEAPDAEGDREFVVGVASTPILPRSALLCRAQGRRLLPLIGFGRDDMNGRVVWNGRGLHLHHEAQAVVGRIAAAMDLTAEAYGWDKRRRRDEPAAPKRSWMSIHPMGGCRMAAEPTTGVVDFRGEVFGHPGLHVADASVFASAPAAGPALSITALSSWIAERIVEQAGRAGA